VFILSYLPACSGLVFSFFSLRSGAPPSYVSLEVGFCWVSFRMGLPFTAARSALFVYLNVASFFLA